jgi:peptidyl-prolyl cis-trans isomerase B (cyclophilin B)
MGPHRLSLFLPPAWLATALACSLGACGSTGQSTIPPPAAAQSAMPGVRAVPPLVLDPDPRRAVAQLEDARTPGPRGELLEMLRSKDASLRARAATAAGRMRAPIGGALLTDVLAGLLADPDPGVGAAAAFALGMRNDARAFGPLMARAAGAEADANVRARCVEAASKLAEEAGALEDPARLEPFLRCLEDREPGVRLEAFVGTSRWKRGAHGDAIDGRLAAAVAREPLQPVRRYGLFALERRKAAAGRPLFLSQHRSEDAEERLFAARGLSTFPPDAEIEMALLEAVTDADWRVGVEALRGLSKSSTPPALEAVLLATRHANHHVRAAAVEAAAVQAAALGILMRQNPALSAQFQGLLADLSPAVRAAAIANPLIGNALTARTQAAGDISPHVRAAGVLAYGKFTISGGVNPLQLAGGSVMAPNETSLLVRGAEIEALALLPAGEASHALAARLGLADNGLRLAALTALLELTTPAVEMAEVARCFDTARGEVATEVRFNALKLAGKLGGDAALELLQRGLQDEDAYVRQVAREELTRALPSGDQRLRWPPPEALPPVELAFPGAGLLAHPRPRVVISTDRGELEFELFAEEAPQHVANFLARAESYRGTTFHRVVSDFVVQGGDARGDGNGGASWRGDALRHEITPRKYVRGSLGMPRNEDWDSGGSQLFVTHRMTPHLDGRYTIFGELVKGFDVLDLLDLGDVIREVRVIR